MRTLPSLSSAIVIALALAPSPATAQQHGALAVDVDGTSEAPAKDAQRKSAFGRVMDVMIAALVQQEVHGQPAAAAPKVSTHHLQPAKAASTTAPRIDITLGGEFALPPEKDAVKRPESVATAANL